MPLICGAKCDICKCSYTFHKIDAKRYIVSDLRKLGWSMGKYTKCPRCNLRKRQLSINAIKIYIKCIFSDLNNLGYYLNKEFVINQIEQIEGAEEEKRMLMKQVEEKHTKWLSH